jgi:hypothetical protein
LKRRLATSRLFLFARAEKAHHVRRTEYAFRTLSGQSVNQQSMRNQRVERVVADRPETSGGALRSSVPQLRRAPLKIGFLLNHDAGHQAAHVLPIIDALARIRPRAQLTAFVGGPHMGEAVRAGLAPPASGRVKIAELTLAPPLALLGRALDPAMPASRVGRLFFNEARFHDLDALVAPERTSLQLKRALEPKGVKFVHIRHGAGDRAIGFHPSFSRFDLLLLQGEKYVRRLKETGGINGNSYALIGYPKFDQLIGAGKPSRFFENGRPTIVYNPHFSPSYSSWFRWGARVLDWFADQRDYNLIFAPHVMLFRRRLHVAPETRALALTGALKERHKHAPNILVDTDSPRLFDMSYMRAADLYLGDISSQIMEFIAEPRPAVFLDPFGADWRGDPNYAAWSLGDVVTDISQLGSAIQSALASPCRYRDRQKAHFDDTFSLTDEPSSLRAAYAIAEFLEARNPSS